MSISYPPTTNADDAAEKLVHALHAAVEILCHEREQVDLPRQRQGVTRLLYVHLLEQLHSLPDELVNNILNTPDLHAK